MATGDRNYDIAKESTSQEILNAMGDAGGGVKHIQRGTFTYDGSLTDRTKEIDLTGFTNLDKMSVRLYGNFIGLRSGLLTLVNVYVKELTLTKLVCEPSDMVENYNAGSPSTCSYEVIEFC